MLLPSLLLLLLLLLLLRGAAISRVCRCEAHQEQSNQRQASRYARYLPHSVAVRCRKTAGARHAHACVRPPNAAAMRRGARVELEEELVV